MSAALSIYDLDHRDDEALSAAEWARLIGLGRPDGFTVRAFNLATVPAEDRIARNAMGQPVKLYRFRNLPDRWREELTAQRQAQGVSLCRDLLEIAERATAWVPPKTWFELPAATREKAEAVRRIMIAYFGWLEIGLPKTEANTRARAEWLKAFGKDCTEKTIRLWERRLNERGAKFIPVAALRKEAFCDGKSCEHKGRRKHVPADFARWFTAQFLDSTKGVPTMGTVYALCEARWEKGEVIPGVGVRSDVTHPSLTVPPFPFTKAQLRPLVPGRAAREAAGRGKALAKFGGYYAAPPSDWSRVEPMRVVQFDDKQLDIEILTDAGLKPYRPIVYIAYCAGTRRVLGFLVREDGHTRQLDVEGLMAAVIGSNGLGGPEAGWQTTFKVERGTVAVSDPRKEFLEMIFAGRLEIERTAMLGGKAAPGDYAQRAVGNFFGKGVIEALMMSIDIFAKQFPGATGNRYDNQPAMLGDTTLTLERIVNSAKAGHSSSRSLIEEGIATAQLARVLEYVESGEVVSACEAARRQGVEVPLLHTSDFIVLLGELFRAHNNRRGHRMQGFATVRVPHPDPEIAATGRTFEVTESPNEKAARMLGAMALQNRRLMAPHPHDIAALLAKVKRVLVTPSGCRTTIDGTERLYWHEQSVAMAEAARIEGAAKTYLALYNPADPSALYLLKNPPSHLAVRADVLPEGFAPQVLEILPVFTDYDPTDRAAQQRKGERVAAFNARLDREILVKAAPILLDRTERREELRDRLEPLRAAVRTVAPSVAPGQLPESALARQIVEGEVVVNEATAEAATRAEQAAAAEPSLIAKLRARAAEKAAQTPEEP